LKRVFMKQCWPETGIFTLSFDVELIWGTYYGLGKGTDWAEERFAEVRPIITKILEMLKEAGIPATWAFVGHLFLDHCERVDGVAHPEVIRPEYGWFQGDWFDFDPCSDRDRKPAWYGKDLVEMVLAADDRHDVGGHSFSHIFFGDPDCSPEAAASDLARLVEAASELGLDLLSFVYPQKKVGHLEALEKAGFRIFRGEDARWYYSKDWVPAPVRRVCHLIDQFSGWTPPVVLPRREKGGLWELPGSLPILPAFGIRKYMPMRIRLRKAKRGIDRAVREKRIYHLWSHPWNFIDRTDELMGVVEALCEHVAKAVREGDLKVMTMREVYEAVSATGD